MSGFKHYNKKRETGKERERESESTILNTRGIADVTGLDSNCCWRNKTAALIHVLYVLIAVS